MLLHISPSPLFQPICISFSSSSPTKFILKCRQIQFDPIRCSALQARNVGAVDFEKKQPLKWGGLYRKISMMDNPSLGSGFILDQLEEEEDIKLSKWLLCRAAKELRKFNRFTFALQVYEWMADRKDRFAFNSSDMAIQLDLIAKAYGISNAEEFFSKLPTQLKDKRTHGALLNAYCKAKLKEKAELLLEKMKAKGYAADTLPFNVMMTLYTNLEEYDKVNMMIDEMKEKNIKFDLYTYNIWITNCASMENIEEMERVVDMLISDSSIDPNWTTYSTIASEYIKIGNFEKAEKCLKEVESRIMDRDRKPFNYLIGHYSNTGKKEEVYRIWNLYKSSFPSVLNLGYQAMLSSLVKLDDIDKAEEIYEEWLSTTSNYDPRICNIVMGWYARQGLVYKAKSLLDRFMDKGGKPKPYTWEILAEGYVKEKQVSNAVLCLKNASLFIGTTRWRPKPVNVANIISLCKGSNNLDDIDTLKEVLRNRGCLEHEEYRSLISI